MINILHLSKWQASHFYISTLNHVNFSVRHTLFRTNITKIVHWAELNFFLNLSINIIFSASLEKKILTFFLIYVTKETYSTYNWIHHNEQTVSYMYPFYCFYYREKILEVNTCILHFNKITLTKSFVNQYVHLKKKEITYNIYMCNTDIFPQNCVHYGC